MIRVAVFQEYDFSVVHRPFPDAVFSRLKMRAA